MILYMSKEDIIAKVFFDPAGYGSINETLKDAKRYDPSITYEDVQNWKNKHTERKIPMRGQNSFIASKPYQEYQMDFFLN